MYRYTLRTRYLTALPYTRALTAADYIDAARRLRALDDGDAPEKVVALIRSHAVQYAIPSWWRERNKLTSPPWPHHSLIETWIALGASRALDREPPEANVPAYAAGYVTTITAYEQGRIMSEVRIEIPEGGIDPRLAAAWVKTAAEVGTLSRDESGPKGAYSSADNVSATAKEAMAKNGLTWARVGVNFEACKLATCELGNQYYVGDSVETWMLVHESGAVLTGTTRAAVIASKGRPHDKAGAATLTYNSGQTLRGLFNMEREGKHSTERRLDDERQGPSSSTPPVGLIAPETATAIGSLCEQIAMHVGRDDVDRMTILRAALEQTGHQYNVDIHGAKNLTPAEALLVHRWLLDDLKNYGNDDDQRQPGDDGGSR